MSFRICGKLKNAYHYKNTFKCFFKKFTFEVIEKLKNMIIQNVKIMKETILPPDPQYVRSASPKNQILEDILQGLNSLSPDIFDNKLKLVSKTKIPMMK